MIDRVFVYRNDIKIGTIAKTNDNKIVFQYDEEWIKNGFSINPFILPLNNSLFYAKSPYFNGLFGVFADSLPDSYGELILERYLNSKNIDISTISPLDRLSYIGSSGMGLLEYRPDYSNYFQYSNIDLDAIQKDVNNLLSSKKIDDISRLFKVGASSGGTRPKALLNIDGNDVIVKFSSRFDPKNIAELEYKYMIFAQKCGICIPKVKLIESKSGNKYFVIERFDRKNGNKIHTITVSGLIECDYRLPSLDYNDLLKLTYLLTKNTDDVIEMYRRMVFNVVFDNQDDHAKNFSFYYDEINKDYRLAPAYDLTPGRTYYKEHTTSINGKGKDITEEDIISVALKNNIKIETAKEIINTVKQVYKNEIIEKK